VAYVWQGGPVGGSDQGIGGEWVASLAAGDSPANYSVYASQVSASPGATLSGTLNTWLALSSSRSWQISTANPGSYEWTLDLTIRSEETGAYVGAARITLVATAT
jgi:hypothetical protein